MPPSKYHLNEYRMKKYMRESPWAKVQRLRELKKLMMRCKNVLPASDQSCPHYSHHILAARRRAEIEDTLGGAKNWIGKYNPNEKKELCDARPWRRISNCKPHPAPFSTLKLSPRGDKMRVIEKNLAVMYDRIKEVEDMPSQYAIVKRTYLQRGDSPWPRPPPKATSEDKLDRIRKWEMKHHPRPTSLQPGFFAALFGTGTTPKHLLEPKPASAPAAGKKRPASAPSSDAHALAEEPPSISAVTEKEAEKDTKLAQLKAVQEAGDPNF